MFRSIIRPTIFISSIGFGLMILFFLSSCNDLLTDTELLENDQADILYKEDFSLQASTIVEDSVFVYAPNVEYSNYILGQMNDPIFGTARSSLTGQVRLSASIINPAFTPNGYDSIVLSLAYSSTTPYGKADEAFGFDVFQVTENIDAEATYYSNQEFSTSVTPIGSHTYTPKPNDSTAVNLYFNNAVILDTLLGPQERIRLNDAFGMELYDFLELKSDSVSTDTTILVTSDDILDIVNGLQIQPTTENNGLVGFDLRSTDSRLTMYYTHTDNDGTTTHREQNFYFTNLSAKTSHFDMNRSGTTVEEFIDTPSLGDSLLFVQGMAGPFVKIEFSDIKNQLSNVIVNKAELEIYAADIDDGSITYTPNSQLILLEEVDDSRVFIEDAQFAINFNILSEFGGSVQTEIQSGLQKYIFNVSSHLQNVIDGNVEDVLYVQPLSKPADFSRTVLYGASHSTYPIRLKLTYTQL